MQPMYALLLSLLVVHLLLASSSMAIGLHGNIYTKINTLLDAMMCEPKDPSGSMVTAIASFRELIPAIIPFYLLRSDRASASIPKDLPKSMEDCLDFASGVYLNPSGESTRKGKTITGRPMIDEAKRCIEGYLHPRPTILTVSSPLEDNPRALRLTIGRQGTFSCSSAEAARRLLHTAVHALSMAAVVLTKCSSNQSHKHDPYHFIPLMMEKTRHHLQCMVTAFTAASESSAQKGPQRAEAWSILLEVIRILQADSIRPYSTMRSKNPVLYPPRTRASFSRAIKSRLTYTEVLESFGLLPEEWHAWLADFRVAVYLLTSSGRVPLPPPSSSPSTVATKPSPKRANSFNNQYEGEYKKRRRSSSSRPLYLASTPALTPTSASTSSSYVQHIAVAAHPPSGIWAVVNGPIRKVVAICFQLDKSHLNREEADDLYRQLHSPINILHAFFPLFKIRSDELTPFYASTTLATQEISMWERAIESLYNAGDNTDLVQNTLISAPISTHEFLSPTPISTIDAELAPIRRALQPNAFPGHRDKAYRALSAWGKRWLAHFAAHTAYRLYNLFTDPNHVNRHDGDAEAFNSIGSLIALFGPQSDISMSPEVKNLHILLYISITSTAPRPLSAPKAGHTAKDYLAPLLSTFRTIPDDVREALPHYLQAGDDHLAAFLNRIKLDLSQ